MHRRRIRYGVALLAVVRRWFVAPGAAVKFDGNDVVRGRVRVVFSVDRDDMFEADEDELDAAYEAMVQAAHEVIAAAPDDDFFRFCPTIFADEEDWLNHDLGIKLMSAADSAAHKAIPWLHRKKTGGLSLNIDEIVREKIAVDGDGFYFVCLIDTGGDDNDFWPDHPRDVDSTYEQWEAEYAGCRTVDEAYARLAKLGNNDGITCAIRCICYHSNDIPADGGYPDTQYDDRTIEFYGGEVVRDDECPKCRKVVKWVDDGEWSWGGCGMRYHSHCKKCGLKRVVYQGGQYQNHWDVEYGDGNDEDGDDD